MLLLKKVGVLIKYLLYGEGVNPLPTNIVASLFILLLFNSMTMTMAFSFIPKLVKSFGNNEVDTGYKVGILGGALYFGQILSSFIWGWAADKYGRKRFTVLSAVCIATTTLAFGFTFNYEWAVTMRLLQGLSTGLTVIGKAIIAEHSDDTNHSMGMLFTAGAYSLGSIIGPSIGGFLAFPRDHYTGIFTQNSIFSKFVVLLPCLIVSLGIFASCIYVWNAIPKTKRNVTVTTSSNNNMKISEETQLLNVQNYIGKYQIKMVIFENISSDTTKLSRKEISVWKELFKNKNCMLTCTLIGLLSFIALGYGEVFPLYCATIKEYKGYQFETFEIGITLMVTAAVIIVIQLTVLSRILAKVGLIKTIQCCNIILGFTFPIIPLCHYIDNRYLFWFVMITVTGTVRLSAMTSFICANVLVNNSVEPKYLASVNGIAMTIANIARSIGVALFGALYSWSLTNIKSIKDNAKPLGFPFNQYFVFFIFSVGSIFIALFVFILPYSLEKKYEKESESN